MKIEIAYNEFYLDEYSLIEINAYKLTIKEENFDEKTANLDYQFSDRKILLPKEIERQINKSASTPKSKVFIDNKGNYKIIIEYD